jgi:hypothetical protein
MPDPIDTAASDWELAFLGGVAFARYGGAGQYFAVFRSRSAGALEPFYLAASGIGAGGNASGFDPRNMSGLQFSGVEVRRPFSLRQIHLSAGTLLSASIGAPRSIPLNYGYSYLDAGRDGVTFFASRGPGPSMGSGTGVFAFMGIWYSHRLNGNSANPAQAYGESLLQSINDLLSSWERGIRDIYTPRF